MTASLVRCVNPACRHDDQPRDAAPGILLCLRCLARLRQHIAEMPAQVAWLHANLTPGAAAACDPVSGSRQPPAPLRLAILSLIGPAARFTVHDPHCDQDGVPNIPAVLASWCTLLAGEAHLDPPGDDRIATTAAYLAGNLDLAAALPWIGDLLGQVAELRNLALRAAPAQRGKRGIRNTACFKCDALALVIDLDRREVECVVRQGGCGRIWREHEYDWLGHALIEHRAGDAHEDPPADTGRSREQGAGEPADDPLVGGT